MDLIDPQVIDDTIVKGNIVKHRLIYLKYLLSLHNYMNNLFNESRKLSRELEHITVNNKIEMFSYIICESETLVELLIEPIKMINRIIARETELLMKYSVVFEQFNFTQSNIDN